MADVTESNRVFDDQWEPVLGLLAIIHRDGGHYTGEHGIEKACEDAVEVVGLLRERLDRAEYDLAESRKQIPPPLMLVPEDT